MEDKAERLKEEYKNILISEESFDVEIKDIKFNFENFKWHISNLNQSLEIEENQKSIDLIHANIKGAKEMIKSLKFKLKVFKEWKNEIYG